MTDRDAVTAISFSSCGWLMLYNFGVAKAMSESNVVGISAPELLGSSGGALTACGLVLGLDFDDIAEFALKCVDQSHGPDNIKGAFDLRSYVTECLKRQFDAFDSAEAGKSPGAGSTSRAKESEPAPAPVAEEVGQPASPGRGGSGALGAPPGLDEDEDEEPARQQRTVVEALEGKVTVSVTTLPWLRNKRYSSFDSREHVVKVE